MAPASCRPPSYQLFDPYAGNPDLEPETSRSADLGVAQDFGGPRPGTATLFWLEIDDLIEYDDASSRFFQTDGTATSQGLELPPPGVTDALILSGAYTYTDARAEARRGIASRATRLNARARRRGDRPGEPRPRRSVHGRLPRRDRPAGHVRLRQRLRRRQRPRRLRDHAAAELYLRAENLTNAEYQTARGFSTADQAFYFGIRGVF